MAIKFVDVDNGLDTNNGSSPDASDSTNKPWKSIGKAWATLASGDSVYIAPGVYRETVVASQAWTSRTRFIGDPLNKQGFKNSSGIRKAAGIPRWTAFTTSDTAAAAASMLLHTNGKSWFSLEYVYMEGAPGQDVIYCRDGTSANMLLDHVVLLGSGNALCFNIQMNYQLALNLTIDNSVLFGAGSCIPLRVLHTSGVSGDWDPSILLRNTELSAPGYTVLQYSKSGASAGVAGGATLKNCTLFGAYGILTGNSSSTLKWLLRQNVIIAASNPVAADATNQVDSDYNHYIGGGNASVTLGAHDHTTDWAYHFDMGASRLFGLGSKPFWSLMTPTPWQNAGTNLLTTDQYDGPRGAANSLGVLEAYDGFGQASGVIRRPVGFSPVS